MAYKKKLNEARKLRGNGGVLAYDRIKLLVEVWRDKDYRNDIGSDDDFAVGDSLDDEMDGLNLTFHESRIMLDKYPHREEWEGGQLRKMYDEIVKKTLEGNQPEHHSSSERWSCSRAQYEELLSEKKDADFKAKTLEQSLEKVQPLTEQFSLLQDKYDRLVGKYERLKLQLKSREGKLVEA